MGRKLGGPLPHIWGGGGAAGSPSTGIEIDHGEYLCMHDRLPLTGLCLGSCHLFEFWQLSENI